MAIKSYVGVKSPPVVEHDGGVAQHWRHSQCLAHLPQRNRHPYKGLKEKEAEEEKRCSSITCGDLSNGVGSSPHICVGEQAEEKVRSSKLLIGLKLVDGQHWKPLEWSSCLKSK